MGYLQNDCICGHAFAIHDVHGCLAMIFGVEGAQASDCGCIGYQKATDAEDANAARLRPDAAPRITVIDD